MSDNHDDAATDLLIREVDEELRQDQMTLLWKKYGSLMIAAAVALVLGVAGWQAWQTWDSKQRQASSQRYLDAVQMADQGKGDQAAADLAKLSVDGTKGYRLLADMKRAAMDEAKGDLAGAAALYHGVASSGAADAAFRDLALLKASYIDLDKGDPAVIAAAVKPLAEESSPWRHSAREILALAALKRGDTVSATDTFRKLADDVAAPQGVRARAAEMLATLQAKS